MLLAARRCMILSMKPELYGWGGDLDDLTAAVVSSLPMREKGSHRLLLHGPRITEPACHNALRGAQQLNLIPQTPEPLNPKAFWVSRVLRSSLKLACASCGAGPGRCISGSQGFDV